MFYRPAAAVNPPRMGSAVPAATVSLLHRRLESMVTDGSAQLRYPSGKDAATMLDARQNDGDDKFLKQVGALLAL
ncbi:Hypothetical protein NGAL_HAMBI490_27400 [Neorhizobium galegae bv. officinalis]|nr:Hypothetical protein NGAL_HAMBI490_27400 [Neorhizobium galegae bv. officinalis]